MSSVSSYMAHHHHHHNKLNLPIMLIMGMMFFMGIFTPLRFALAKPTKASSPPSALDFFMYIAVQNNSFLNNPATFTAIQSAQPLKLLPNSFGIIHTFHNPLTDSPSLLNSTRLGHVQGFYGDVGLDVLTLFLAQTFTFTTDKWKGTFSLLGVDLVTDGVKYAPIVGGTGDFAYARGVAAQTLISTNVVDSLTVSWFRYHVDFKY